MDLFELRYPITEEERTLSEAMRSRVGVARTLLDRRLRLGLTQVELGRHAGTKQSRVSEIEGLKGNPRFDTLDRIATVLGLMIALVPRNPPTVSLVPQFRTDVQRSINTQARGTPPRQRWRNNILTGVA